MPRYEPRRNAEPFLQPGGTLKMRRTADGTFKPVAAEEHPAADADAEAETPDPAGAAAPPAAPADEA